MARSNQLVLAIKSELKRLGLTYAALAERLDLSESTVKQMFASGNFNLKKLDQICEVLQLELDDLLHIAAASTKKIERVSIAVEQQLVADTKLLLVAYCLLNHWRVSEIIEHYEIDEFEITTLLAKLDRLKLLELLPGNRVRMLVANNFDWLPGGPIDSYFSNAIQHEFFATDFADEASLRIVKNGMLSARSLAELHSKLKAIDQHFDELNHGERRVPIHDRHGVTMILAIRNWVTSAFVELKRNRR